MRISPSIYAVLINLTFLSSFVACKADCASRSLDECRQTDGCSAVSASRIADGCTQKPSDVACTDSEVDCDTSLTVARDQQGAEWLFPSTCVPSGWTPLQQDGAYPVCD